MGVDGTSIKIVVNGEDKTSVSIFEEGILTYTPANDSPLPLSSFKVDITASDLLGNEANATFSYVKMLADKGFIKAFKDSKEIRTGLNIYKGKVTHPNVAKAFDLEYIPPEEAVGE